MGRNEFLWNLNILHKELAHTTSEKIFSTAKDHITNLRIFNSKPLDKELIENKRKPKKIFRKVKEVKTIEEVKETNQDIQEEIIPETKNEIPIESNTVKKEGEKAEVKATKEISKPSKKISKKPEKQFKIKNFKKKHNEISQTSTLLENPVEANEGWD